MDVNSGGTAMRTPGRARAAPASWFDCAGGGQVVVEKSSLTVAIWKNPHGTLSWTLPIRNVEQLASISMPTGTHSHKVRVVGDLMVTNRESAACGGVERPDTAEGYHAGSVSTTCPTGEPGSLPIGILQTARARPTPAACTALISTAVRYISPTLDGYVGNIVMILDLKDPGRPEEVGRWWMPGQWTAGGEKPTWRGDAHKCHHPLRHGNRLYTSYWHGGLVILDIDDLSKPKFVSGLDWSPPFPWPTHTCLRIPFKIANRDFMLVTDEDVFRMEDYPKYPAAFLWMVDITDEKHPQPVSTYQVEDMPDTPQPRMTGCHSRARK